MKILGSSQAVAGFPMIIFTGVNPIACPSQGTQPQEQALVWSIITPGTQWFGEPLAGQGLDIHMGPGLLGLSVLPRSCCLCWLVAPGGDSAP